MSIILKSLSLNKRFLYVCTSIPEHFSLCFYSFPVLTNTVVTTESNQHTETANLGGEESPEAPLPNHSPRYVPAANVHVHQEGSPKAHPPQPDNGREELQELQSPRPSLTSNPNDDRRGSIRSQDGDPPHSPRGRGSIQFRDGDPPLSPRDSIQSRDGDPPLSPRARVQADGRRRRSSTSRLPSIASISSRRNSSIVEESKPLTQRGESTTPTNDSDDNTD